MNAKRYELVLRSEDGKAALAQLVAVKDEAAACATPAQIWAIANAAAARGLLSNIAAGIALLELRDAAPRGAWEAMVEKHWRHGPRWAQRCIAVAREFFALTTDRERERYLLQSFRKASGAEAKASRVTPPGENERTSDDLDDRDTKPQKIIDIKAEVRDAGPASPPGRLPRGRCPTCHVEVAVRVTGEVREHRSDSGTSMCAGGMAILPDAPHLPAVVEDQDDAAMPDVQGPPDDEDRSAEQDVDDLDDTPEGDADDEVLCDVCGVEPVETDGATCTPCINKAAGIGTPKDQPAAGPQGVPAAAPTPPPAPPAAALPTTAPILLLAAPGTGLGEPLSSEPVSPVLSAVSGSGFPHTLTFLEALEKELGKPDGACVPVHDLAQLRAAQGLALLVEAGVYRQQAKEQLRAVPGRPDPWALDGEIDKLVCKLAKRFADDDGVVLKTLKGAVAGGTPAPFDYRQGLELARRPTSTDLIRGQVLDETHPFLRPAMRSSCAASPEQTALMLVRDLWSRLDGLAAALKVVRVPARRVEGLSALRDLIEPAIDAATALVRAQHGADAPEPKPKPAGGKKKGKGKGKKGEQDGDAEKDEEVADGE